MRVPWHRFKMLERLVRDGATVTVGLSAVIIRNKAGGQEAVSRRGWKCEQLE